MNMMFVSVSERKKEIGIRKALGASPKKIQAQFLCEAAMLAGSGGLVGAGIGVLAILGANAFIKSLEPAWAGTVSVPAVIAALASSILTGVVFGTVPARRAAALDPVAAIRS
jgi:putative ABC transport system permease protein